jgi:hypothetical protein
MRTKIFTIFAVTILLGTAVTLTANTQIRLISEIPFAFTAGENSFPAGKYAAVIERYRVLSINSLQVQKVASSPVVPAIQSQGPNVVVEVVAEDNQHRGMFLTMSIEARKKAGHHELIFNRYGTNYFLSEVWAGSETGYQLSKSKAERDLAENHTPTQVAILLHR